MFRRSRTASGRFLFLRAVICLFGLAVVSFIVYFVAFRYDFPFRVSGHYEKGLTLSQRPFTLSPDRTMLVFASPRTGHGDLASSKLHMMRGETLVKKILERHG